MSQRHAQANTVVRQLAANPKTTVDEPSHLDRALQCDLALRYRTAVRDRLEEREMVVDHSSSMVIEAIAREMGASTATPRDVVEVHLLAVLDWAEAVSAQRGRCVTTTNRWWRNPSRPGTARP